MWSALSWDSDFFGVRIGRIELDGADPAGIASVEDEARRAGVTCLYAELDPSAVAAIDAVQRLGYRLREVALDLDHPTSLLADQPPTSSTIRRGTAADVGRLAPQLAVVAPWSRYAVDPRFGPGAALALHRAWVERAAGGRDGRMLLVAEDASGCTGMATVHLPGSTEPEGRIDLIASTRPRSGAAQALVAHAFACFGPGCSRGGPIAARNHVSLRFSEQMGYRVSSTRYLFHRWLDEAEPAGSLTRDRESVT